MTKAKNEAFKVGALRVYPHMRGGELSGRWMISIPPHLAPGGKRQRPTFATKTEAEREAKRLQRELQLDGAISGTGQKMAGVTFQDIARPWLDFQKERVKLGNKRQKSLQGDAERMVHLLAHFAAKDIQRISSDALRGYQILAREKRSPSSVNGEVRLMKTILIYAHDRELITKVPKVEPLKEPRKDVELPTMQEMAAILSRLSPSTARVVRFIALTGVRNGEAFNLEWDDLDEAECNVTIRDKENWQAKNESSNRTFPISPLLMAVLMAGKEEGKRKAEEDGKPMPTYVFPGRGGVRMTSYAKAMANAVKEAGVMRDGKPLHINPHKLRKSFITWQIQRGFAETFIQPSVGHVPGSPITSKNYTHHNAEALRVAVLDLGPEDFSPVEKPAAGAKKRA